MGHSTRRGGRWLALSCLALAGSGCGLMDAPGAPRVVAHRAAAGSFPENSRSAVHAALEAEHPGIEVDLVLTQDEVPVLSHDAWLNPELCTHLDGSPLPEGEHVLIKNLTLGQLQEGYRCGGKVDPAMPDAEVVADTHLTLDELLAAAAEHPGVLLQLDIKQDEDTLDAETYARVILARWQAAGLDNPMYLSSNRPETLKAFKAVDPSVTALRIWPEFKPGANTTLTGLGNELTRTFGFQELVQLTHEAHADGIAVAFPVADRGALETVRQAGLKTALWTANKQAELDTFCSWPLDYLITDYPERAPCR